MPMIVIPTEEDDLLEKIVPVYLRGQNKTTQRVRWAIIEVLQQHGIGPATTIEKTENDATPE